MRAIKYLLQRKAKLVEKCEDLVKRLSRNNLQIYSVAEGKEEMTCHRMRLNGHT